MKAPAFVTRPGLSRGSRPSRALLAILRSDAGFESRRDLVKRILDFYLALILIVAFSPVMAMVALAIRCESAGPILFKQKRLGREGRPFTMYKFRTMGNGAEKEQAKLAHLNERAGPVFKISRDPRHTRVGRWARRMSLDELPNLVNVLKGEMSLVGPRPPLPGEVEQYEDWQRRRLQVMPGITGLWQVSGRSKLSFDEQCRLDLTYIEHWSLGLDFWIMLRTIPAVVLATGAY